MMIIIYYDYSRFVSIAFDDCPNRIVFEETIEYYNRIFALVILAAVYLLLLPSLDFVAV